MTLSEGLLYTENQKTLLKEIKDINGKTSHGHQMQDLILLKQQYSLKQAIDLMQSIPIQTPNGLFVK